MNSDAIICPNCNSNNQKLNLTAVDHLVTGDSFQIYACLDCKIKHTYPRPNSEKLAQYYQSSEYYSHMDESKTFFSRVYGMVRNIALVMKRKQIQKITNSRSGKILDIGCGTGEFLNVMQISDWEVKGIDASETARKIAFDKYNLSVDGIEAISALESDYYDIITMWHSLEHVPDPSLYLKNIKRALKQQGLLLIALPNNESYDADHYQEAWAAYDVPRHLYHFSSASITNLLGLFDFQLRSRKGMPFDPFYVSILSEKQKNNGGNLFKGLFIGLISWLFAIFDVERSSSIIYLFKRSV